jgi:hypothetical protein
MNVEVSMDFLDSSDVRGDVTRPVYQLLQPTARSVIGGMGEGMVDGKRLSSNVQRPTKRYRSDD